MNSFGGRHPYSLDPVMFIRGACKIRPAQGGSEVPFGLWPMQENFVRAIDEHQRIIVLKARQLGFSWVALAYSLWLCSQNTGQTALVFSQGLREATDLLDRVRFMWRHMPAELRPRMGRDRFDQIEFPDMDSRIVSLPATEHAGSGYTATFVMMDEWAKLAHAERLYTAVMPTLAAGGRFVGISTAVGYHNLFARMWRESVLQENEMHAIFEPWMAHPDRDDEWYQRKSREMPSKRALMQEYPATAREAFQLPGDVCFDEFDLVAHTTTEPRDPLAGWPNTRGIDFGFHHSPVYWIEVQASRRVYVHDELYGQKMTTKDLAPLILARDLEHGLLTSNVPAGVDPAGVAQTSNSSESDHMTLQQAGIRILDARVAPKDRVTLIKDLLRDGLLAINSDRCPNLVLALEQAQWATVGKDGVVKETYAKDGLYEHALDALGYGLVNIFPVHGKAYGVGGHSAAVGAAAHQAGRDPYSNANFG